MRPFYSSALANFVLAVLPNTKFFSFKRFAIRALGFEDGDNVKFNGGIRFFGRGKIIFGDISWIGMGCVFVNAHSQIVIGSNCDLAPFIRINTGSHLIGSAERRAGSGYCEDILIGNGTWIGMNSIFIAGAKVGAGCVIAAGATVTNKFDDSILIGGCPAKIIRKL